MRRYEIVLTFTDGLDIFVAEADGRAEVSDPNKSEQDIVRNFAEDTIRRQPELRAYSGLKWTARHWQI